MELDTDSSMPSLGTDSDSFEDNYNHYNSQDSDITLPNNNGDPHDSDSSDSHNEGNGDDDHHGPGGDHYGNEDYNYTDNDDCKEDEYDNIRNNNINTFVKDIMYDNNLLFNYQRIGLGKTYISGASAYPPELNADITIGAISGDNARITNKLINGKIVSVIQDKLEVLDLLCNTRIDEFISDTNIKIINDNNNCIGVINGSSKLEAVDNVLEHVVTGENVIEIKDTTRKWWIHANVCTEDGTIIKIRLFADPGANAGCIKTAWALRHFRSFIKPNTKTNTLYTPNGPIVPKYVLYLSFPTKSGLILKAKMYLINKLPVNILADINMLESFGYKFKDGTPEIFRNYSSNSYVNMDLKDDRNIDDISSHDKYLYNKHKYNLNMIHYQDGDKPMMYNKLYGGKELLYDKEYELEDKLSGDTTVTSSNVNSISNDKKDDSEDIYIHQQHGKIEFDKVNNDNICKLTDKDEINKVINDINKYYSDNGNKNNNKIWNFCCFILAKQSFLATEEEKAKAKLLRPKQNLRLQWNTWNYLKEYPEKYGKRFNGLYEAVTACINRNRGVFAQYTFDRETLNEEPTRLGIEEKHRDKIMHAPPYPISEDKRISMINYTIINEENGFWEPIKVSLHSIPYTMVPKKYKNVVYRYRPAFDGRVVNQYCKLMQSNMPTLRDFRELQSIRGFSTMADIKNFFDCIPLHKDDRKYAVAMTPLGLYRMNCQTYGWKNAAPNAQAITNRLCVNIGLALAYIDDICIKHPFNSSVQDIVNQLDKFFNYCKLKNIKLDPTKFYPVTDKTTAFSFSWELFGKRISEEYKKKILVMEPPTTWKKMENYLGVIGYVRNHILNCSHLTYWLNELRNHCNEKGKITWTPQGELAFKQLRKMVIESPLLHHPTKQGQFCIQTDACNYGVGAVLLQKQIPYKEKKTKWVIVDMWSRTIPRSLRHCHSMVHEAYAIVGAIEYWEFELLKRRFIISTDNNPIANIFQKEKWYRLSAITQRQLLRLRVTIDIFDYDTYHVKGLDNKLADSLSRFTSKLIKTGDIKALVRGIDSKDTTNKVLSEKDEEYFNQYLKECEKLGKERSKLSSDNMVAVLHNQLQGEEFEDEVERHLIIMNIRNEKWNELLLNYYNKSSYLIKDNIRGLINNGMNNTIISNEFELNDNSTNILSKNICNIINCINLLSSNLLMVINTEIIEPYNEHKFINQIDNDTDDESLIESNVSDTELDEDELQESSHRRNEPIITRSRRNPSNIKKFSKKVQDIIFANKRLQMQTRKEFMQDIFGYRGKTSIFDIGLLKQHQQNDQICRLLYKLLLTDNNNIDNNEVEYLKEWDVILYNKFIKNEFKINKEIIMVKTDEVTVNNNSLWCILIPFNIRGKIMDYAHHNLQLHHYGYSQTLDFIKERYWWSTLRKDVSWFCKTCLTCQFTKGEIRHRAPMTIRELPPRLTHIFLDFLGPVYGKYYILVIIDYTTGYTMLIPTTGTDAITISETLLSKWIPIFGWFKVFESDWGSGFNSKLIRSLLQASNVKQVIAEPRNHRSIGKVERVIGYIQRVLGRYNIELGEYLTEDNPDYQYKWETVEIILPFIQMAINQHRPRFTTISPNMLIFGSNLNDISDYGIMKQKLQEIQRKEKMNNIEYVNLENLIKEINEIHKIYKKDWMKYTWLSKREYDKKWNITSNKIERNNKLLVVGKRILYYIGDRKSSQYKWKQKWTGPWIIDKRLNDSTIIIGDPETGNQKRVSIDRCKIFNKRDMDRFSELFDNDKSYIDNENELLNMYTRYNVETHSKDIQLEFD